jgi:thiosulfate dehydrogenase [quinone] large subunit
MRSRTRIYPRNIGEGRWNLAVIQDNERQRNAVAFAVLGIVVGLFFIVFGEYKVFCSEFTLHGGFQDGVKGFISGGSAFPFTAPFLHWILAKCAPPVAFLVAYCEFLIAHSLLSGVPLRVASAFGFILMLLLRFSGGYPEAHAALRSLGALDYPGSLFWASWRLGHRTSYGRCDSSSLAGGSRRALGCDILTRSRLSCLTVMPVPEEISCRKRAIC